MPDKGYLINTERLEIIPLSLLNLRLYINDYQAFCGKNGLVFQEKILEEPLKRALSIKIKNMVNDPSRWCYYTYWIMIDKETEQEVGTIGYKGLPDQAGIVEIGFGTVKAFQNKGYMSEALKAFIKGFPDQSKKIKIIKAQVTKTNYPSIRVLEKVKFKRIPSEGEFYFYEFSGIGGVT